MAQGISVPPLPFHREVYEEFNGRLERLVRRGWRRAAWLPLVPFALAVMFYVGLWLPALLAFLFAGAFAALTGLPVAIPFGEAIRLPLSVVLGDVMTLVAIVLVAGFAVVTVGNWLVAVRAVAGRRYVAPFRRAMGARGKAARVGLLTPRVASGRSRRANAVAAAVSAALPTANPAGTSG
jgi:hypothetical protein